MSRRALEDRKKAAEQMVTKAIGPLLNNNRQGTAVSTSPMELLRNNSLALQKAGEQLEASRREILGVNGVIETLASFERSVENPYE